MDTEENARVMTLPQTAAYLGCCLRTVYRRIRSGHLDTVRTTGRRVYVTRESAEMFLRARFERNHGALVKSD